MTTLKDLLDDPKKHRKAVLIAIKEENKSQLELMRKYEFICHEAGRINFSPQNFLIAFDVEVCPCGYKGMFYNCPGYEAKPKGKAEFKKAFERQNNENKTL